MHPIAAAVVAALAGFAEMTLELSAVRLFAPRFGDSAPVWTNVIGVMLAAMAAGAWIGGRLAHAERGRPRLGRLLVGAAAIAALAPFVAGPLAGALLPEELMLDRAMGVLVRGSLAATLLLFAPPVLLAGAVTPMLVTLLARGPLGVGRSSGLVATWSILGGLAGTFLTTHLLVPGIGSRATVWVAATCLAIAAALCVGRPRRGAAVAAVGLALVLWPNGPGLLGPLRAVGEGRVLLSEVESTYQFLQVVRDRRDEPAATLLKINEGLDSFHSVRIDGTPWTGGRYYDWHVVAPWLATDGRPVGGVRILSLGAAAGTFERVLTSVHPEARFDCVELDPAVVALGEAWFDGFGDDSRVHAGIDARVFVEHATATWDVVLVDCYERQIYVPAHVASVEFFTAVRARLAAGGVVSVNVGALGPEDPVLVTIAGTMAAVFGEARALRVPGSRNYVVAARHGAVLDPSSLGRVDATSPELGVILDLAERDDAWHRFEPTSTPPPVLTDDRPFLDLLQERSYAASRAVRPTATVGALTADAAEALASERLAVGDLDGVVEAVGRSRVATPALRFVAGDARWRVGDFAGAAAEYRAGLEGAADPERRADFEQRLLALQPLAAGDAAVDDASRRTGWVTAAGVLAVALLALALRRFGAR